MQKLSLFSIFMLFSSVVLSVNGDKFDDYVNAFFHKNLEYRLNRADLAKEFEGWRIVGDKTMEQLFEEEKESSSVLNRTYEYFLGPIHKIYADGTRSGDLQYRGCVECIRCNVDILIDMFRKSLLEQGQQVETDATAQKDDVVAEKKNEEVSDGDIQVFEEYECHPPESYLPPLEGDIGLKIVIPKGLRKQEVPSVKVEPVTEEKDEDAFEELLRELNGEVEVELTFHDRLLDAIRKAPTGNTSANSKLVFMARKIIGLSDKEHATTRQLQKFNDELQKYLDTKMLDEKKYPKNYTWWERTLINSPFEYASQYGKKLITRQRVAREDKQFVEVALNIKALVAKELANKFKELERPILYIKYHKQRKEALRLALNIY